MPRENCLMRHENGNCLPCGGFCTAVSDSICEALHKAFAHGESEGRDRLVLSMVEANRKYQERSLKILRGIQEKVSDDVVAVVRCKDCKWRYTSGCPYENFDAVQRGGDDYCGDGERREEDGDT